MAKKKNKEEKPIKADIEKEKFHKTGNLTITKK